MFKSSLLHVELLFLWETQKTEDAVLEGRDFELCSELLIIGMKMT